jgi:hypothetical protein
MRSLREVIGVDECVLVLGLVLMAWGFALMPSWAAGSALAPGAALVWMALPQRAAFVKREPAAPLPPRRRA